MDIMDISQVFYDEETRVCNYKQFIATVEAFQPRPSEIVKSATLRSEALTLKVDVDEVMNDVKSIIKQRKINVNDYLRRRCINAPLIAGR